ncbi:hypothetical protein D9M72_604520 [compost metagenome]
MGLAENQPQFRRATGDLFDQPPAVGNLEIIRHADRDRATFVLLRSRIDHRQALPAFVQGIADHWFELIGLERGGQAASGAHEQLIAIQLAQATQGRADGRLRHAQTQRGTAGAGLFVQRFEDFEQVEVDVGDIHLAHIIQQ